MAPKGSTNEALRVSPKAQTSSPQPQPLQHAGPEAIAIIGMGMSLLQWKSFQR